MSSSIRDLEDRAARLRKEATGIRQAASSMSSDEDAALFLKQAAALDAEAADLEAQVEEQRRDRR